MRVPTDFPHHRGELKDALRTSAVWQIHLGDHKLVGSGFALGRLSLPQHVVGGLPLAATEEKREAQLREVLAEFLAIHQLLYDGVPVSLGGLSRRGN